jgi:tRNA C32,U32 (ribose-2'-O)-methylase TrmJ
MNKSLASKAKAAASKADSRSRASKVVRTLDKAASKVAADSRSRASRVVSRTPDKAASMVVDSRSRASSLDSANFPLRESFPGFEPGFFYFDF